MPGNMWDSSGILAGNRAGEIMGQGYSQLGQTLLQAVSIYRQKSKDKEAEDAAVEWLKKNGKDMGLNTQDEGELKAAVKAAGGGMQAVQMISGLETQKQQRAAAAQEQQITAAKLQAVQEDRASRLRESGAAMLATGGNPSDSQLGALVTGGARFQDLQPAGSTSNPDATVIDYLRRSGDTAGAGRLAQTFAQLGTATNKGRDPYPVDFGGGLKGVVANGNFIADPRLKADGKGGAQDLNVGSAEMTIGPGNKYFDKKTGKPVDFGRDRPPTPPPFELKATDPELYDAMRTDYMDWASSRAQAMPPRVDPAEIPGQAAGTGGPVEISTEAEFKKLKPGTRFSFNGRIGIKK